MYPIVKRQSGFTLIEAMIALVILAFAASAVILPFTTAANVQNETDLRTLAIKLAADKLEEIITQDIGTVADQSESKGALKNAAGNDFTDTIYEPFSRSVTCLEAQVGGKELKWVTVEVFYNGEKLANLSTLIGP